MHLAMQPLLKFVMLLFRCIPALFRSRNEQALVELALRQQLATYALKGPKPRITWSTGPSGSFFHESGRVGKTPWSSSGQTPSSAGIARDFGFIGDPFRSGVLDDLPSQSKCRLSFVDSRMRTAGVLERSEQNSKSLGSRSASPPSLDIDRSEILIATSANAGRRFFAITKTASPRWTSSSSPPFGSACCTSGL